VRCFFSLCLAGLAACEPPVPSRSESTGPSQQIAPPPPERIEGWPCPPFPSETTRERLGDQDDDSISDCQEDVLGSDAADADTDGDGAGDLHEVGEVLEPLDTDRDGILDLLDEDDDGDGCPSAEEDPDGSGTPLDDDTDDDGVPDFRDADTAGC
jgi:hypothetical protein